MKSLSAPPVTGSSSSPIGTSGRLERNRRFAGLLHADPQADVEEIRIAYAPLPHPRTADYGVQFLRIAVHEKLAAALFLSGALHFFAVFIELA